MQKLHILRAILGRILMLLDSLEHARMTQALPSSDTTRQAQSALRALKAEVDQAHQDATPTHEK